MIEHESPFKPQSAYLRLFKGERVPLSTILSQTPFVKPAIDVLIADGRLIGQEFINGQEQDLLLWVPKHEPRGSR